MIADAAHRPVLLEEAVAALALKPKGTYVDATFGRGGHSRRILDLLGEEGRLVAIDRDPTAEAEALAWRDPRFSFRRAWFSDLPQALDAAAVAAIDGVLFDLGVFRRSSTIRSAGFPFAPTDRSTCAWILRAARPPRSGLHRLPNVN